MESEYLFKKKEAPFDLFEVDILSASDKDLKEISNKMGLALNVDEMKRIKEYFNKKKRNPTDIELQARAGNPKFSNGLHQQNLSKPVNRM